MTRVRKKRSGNYKNPYGKAKIKLPEDDDNMEGITVLAVFVLFMSCFYILNHFTILDLSAFGLFKVYCFFIGASFLIPIRLYRKSLTMSMYEYIIFNILSIAPLFCSSFFILNDSFSGQPYTETYNVTSAIREDLHTYYILENNQYEDQPYLRTFNTDEDFEYTGSDSLSITFSDGLFGLRLIDKKRLH